MNRNIRRPATAEEAKASTIKVVQDRVKGYWTINGIMAFTINGNPIYTFLRRCTNIQMAIARYHGLDLNKCCIMYDTDGTIFHGNITMDKFYIVPLRTDNTTFMELAYNARRVVLERVIKMTNIVNVQERTRLIGISQTRFAELARQANAEKQEDTAKNPTDLRAPVVPGEQTLKSIWRDFVHSWHYGKKQPRKGLGWEFYTALGLLVLFVTLLIGAILYTGS